MGKFGAVIVHIDAKTPQEARDSLVAAGIIDTTGKLAKKYKSKSKSKKK